MDFETNYTTFPDSDHHDTMKPVFNDTVCKCYFCKNTHQILFEHADHEAQEQ